MQDLAPKYCMALHWGAVQVLMAALAFLALRLKVDILWVALAGAGVSALVL